jgi:SdpC family antimicrobial peptide
MSSMNEIRRVSRSRLGRAATTTVAAAFLSLTSGCDQPPPNASTTEVAPRFDGKTLFKGVFFNNGPVADRLPAHSARRNRRAEQSIDPQVTASWLETAAQDIRAKNGSVEMADRFAKLAVLYREGKGELPDSQDQITGPQVDQYAQLIQKSDPTFFARFGEMVQSGDHLQVKRAIDEGRQIVWKASQAALDDTSGYLSGGGGGLKPPSYNPVVHEAFLVTYIAVLFFIVLTQIDATPYAAPNSGNTALEKDQLVEEIVANLGTAAR